MAYANGTVAPPESAPSSHERPSNRRAGRKRPVHQTTLLSSAQQLQRDRLVDAERNAIMSSVQGRTAEQQVKQLCMEVRWSSDSAEYACPCESIVLPSTCCVPLVLAAWHVVVQVGSHGLPEYAQLEYYDPKLHMPYASYHVLFLGTAKKFLSFVVSRLVPASDRQGQGEVGIASFKFATFVKGLVGCRLRHIVLRSSSKCGVCNFVEHLGAMTIAEMQLLYEVALPYIMHDWVQCGVPETVVLMGCERPPRCMPGIRCNQTCKKSCVTSVTIAPRAAGSSRGTPACG